MKILLVDDHPIFLQGLKNLLLAYGMNVIDTAASGEEALQKVGQLSVDVILMDIMMKPLSGLETTRIIKARFPEIKIIMLTASEKEEDLFEAVKCGASGYLLKSLDADALCEMLSQYEKGEVPASAWLAQSLLKEFEKDEAEPMKEDDVVDDIDDKVLTARQKNVLVMVAKGIKYKDIAISMKISERTVKYYMEIILNKLHMENRNQVIKYAVKKGIVD
jgi:two-component system NarL family response regulator